MPEAREATNLSNSAARWHSFQIASCRSITLQDSGEMTKAWHRAHLLICLQEGIIALWKGWLPSVIGVIPYVGLNFAVYETLKDSVLKFYGAPQSKKNCDAHSCCVTA